jgi:hypothetical protein
MPGGGLTGWPRYSAADLPNCVAICLSCSAHAWGCFLAARLITLINSLPAPPGVQTLASEIQRRENTFRGMLGELERIAAKCAQLTSTISGTAAVGARPRAASAADVRALMGSPGPGTAHQTYTYGAAAPAGPPAPARDQCCDVGSFASSDTEDAIPALRQRGEGGHYSPRGGLGGTAALATGCRSSLGMGDGAGIAAPAQECGRAAGAAADEWSWESLMQFERTIKEQHRKVSWCLPGVACSLWERMGGFQSRH